MTECNQSKFEFATHFQRQVVAGFDGGTISSESGSLLLREVEQRTGIVRQFAACFRDYRDPEKIEHRVEELIAQRVYGRARGGQTGGMTFGQQTYLVSGLGEKAGKVARLSVREIELTAAVLCTSSGATRKWLF